jgi:hypothetical protein
MMHAKYKKKTANNQRNRRVNCGMPDPIPVCAIAWAELARLVRLFQLMTLTLGGITGLRLQNPELGVRNIEESAL